MFSRKTMTKQVIPETPLSDEDLYPIADSSKVKVRKLHSLDYYRSRYTLIRHWSKDKLVNK